MRYLWILALMPSVAWAGARVSAYQKESRNGANTWNAAAAIDGKLETAWMVPGESDNKGEWLEIDIPKGEVDKIAIFPGFNRDEETFADYPRVKTVRVDVFAFDEEQSPKQVGTATLNLADKREWQVLDLPDTKVEEGMFGGRVRVTIQDVYEGRDYPNLGVSEVLVHLKEFDAKVKVSGVSAEVPGKGSDLMLDENAKTAFAAPGSTLEFTIVGSGYGISGVGFQSAGKDYARPKTVEVTAGNNTVTTVLPDSLTAPQFAAVPGFNGYSGGAFGDVQVKVVDVYPGAKLQEIGIAELKVKATHYEAL